jgi:hypothetical protein
MEFVTSKFFSDPAKLSEDQLARIHVLLNIAHALWAAWMKHPVSMVPMLRLHNRCVFATIVCAEVARRLGYEQATPLKFGVNVFGQCGLLRRQMVIGAPCAPVMQGMINAHAVLGIGDVIVDPTMAQKKRPWNDMPHIGAVVVDAPSDTTVEIVPGCTVSVVARANMTSPRSTVEISYFKLPRSVERATRHWLNTRDVRRPDFEEIVRAATAIAAMRLAASDRPAP